MPCVCPSPALNDDRQDGSSIRSRGCMLRRSVRLKLWSAQSQILLTVLVHDHIFPKHSMKAAESDMPIYLSCEWKRC